MDPRLLKLVDKKIEQLRQYNLGAQEMSKKLLEQNGYPADYLDVHYSCPFCRDTGYFFSDML